MLIDGGDDHHNGVSGSASSCGSIERVLLKKAYRPQRNTSIDGIPTVASYFSCECPGSLPRWLTIKLACSDALELPPTQTSKVADSVTHDLFAVLQ